MMNFIKHNFWLILFVIWGFPLTIYRSQFRKLVYQTDSWIINIKPVFMKEINGLFGNIYPDNLRYKKFRNFYRLYLAVYFLLFIFYLDFNSYSQTTNTNDMGKIGVGSTIPSFSLKDQNGNVFEIDSVKGKKNLVIYFYPKDDSSAAARLHRVVFKKATRCNRAAAGASAHQHISTSAHQHINTLTHHNCQLFQKFGKNACPTLPFSILNCSRCSGNDFFHIYFI